MSNHHTVSMAMITFWYCRCTGLKDGKPSNCVVIPVHAALNLLQMPRPMEALQIAIGQVIEHLERLEGDESEHCGPEEIEAVRKLYAYIEQHNRTEGTIQ